MAARRPDADTFTLQFVGVPTGLNLTWAKLKDIVRGTGVHPRYSEGVKQFPDGCNGAQCEIIGMEADALRCYNHFERHGLFGKHVTVALLKIEDGEVVVVRPIKSNPHRCHEEPSLPSAIAEPVALRRERSDSDRAPRFRGQRATRYGGLASSSAAGTTIPPSPNVRAVTTPNQYVLPAHPKYLRPVHTGVTSNGVARAHQTAVYESHAITKPSATVTSLSIARSLDTNSYLRSYKGTRNTSRRASVTKSEARQSKKGFPRPEAKPFIPTTRARPPNSPLIVDGSKHSARRSQAVYDSDDDDDEIVGRRQDRSDTDSSDGNSNRSN